MPRQARLYAPVALHHIHGSWDRAAKNIFHDQYRDEFVRRLCEQVNDIKMQCFARALIPNHLYL